MVGHFKETGHPVFKGISALNRGILRRGGRCTKHFEADSSNMELLICTIHSANHFSICRAVASWCEEMAQRIPSQNELTAEKSVAEENEHLLKNVKPQEGATMGHLETDCKNNFRDLKHWDSWSVGCRAGSFTFLEEYRVTNQHGNREVEITPVENFWGHWSGDQNDHQRQKSDNETRGQKPAESR